MKRVLIAMLMVLAYAGIAGAQALPINYNNMFFFTTPCLGYNPGTPPPGQGAMCIDIASGGMYLWNAAANAFSIGGSELLPSNAGAGQTTATTTYFTLDGNSTNATTETTAMQLPVGPNPFVIRNLTCYDSAAPGAGNTDAYTVRTATSLGGTMGTTLETCSITGASAKSCQDTTHAVSIPAGSVIDMQDVTTGTPAARTIGCVLQVDEL